MKKNTKKNLYISLSAIASISALTTIPLVLHYNSINTKFSNSEKFSDTKYNNKLFKRKIEVENLSNENSEIEEKNNTYEIKLLLKYDYKNYENSEENIKFYSEQNEKI